MANKADSILNRILTPRIWSFLLLILYLFLLSAEGLVIGFISMVWHFDDSYYSEVAGSAAWNAYLISMTMVAVWGIILLFKKPAKGRTLYLSLGAMVGALLMIVLTVLIGQHNIQLLNP